VPGNQTEQVKAGKHKGDNATNDEDGRMRMSYAWIEALRESLDPDAYESIKQYLSPPQPRSATAPSTESSCQQHLLTRTEQQLLTAQPATSANPQHPQTPVHVDEPRQAHDRHTVLAPQGTPVFVLRVPS